MINVYTGPMYSGKSKALIKTYEDLTNKSQALCFKPSKDSRDKSKIKSRDLNIQIDSIVIKTFTDILKHIKENTKYIFIDEAQFITGDFNILQKLSIEKDIDIYIAGLNKTSNQKPFGTMPYILSIADKIEILNAECECGEKALYTISKTAKEQDILIDTGKEYKSVCRKCLLKYKR